MPPEANVAQPGMIDGFGRRISYVRLSVTDRCDLRCRYCMSERMDFLPRRELLTLEEIAALARTFIARGVSRIRLTGGEPLGRSGILDLVGSIGEQIGNGLHELTLTTNGTRLARFAAGLHTCGVRRVNVSLDTLDAARFAHITRGGNLRQVLDGIEAARAAGMAVKINMVALAGVNEDEIEPMLHWCAAHGHDLTLIETMPLGQVEEDRTRYHLSLAIVRRRLEEKYTLVPSARRTGGPARHHEVPELGTRIGFITPLSENFCDGCNRIRVTARGDVYGCLGHDQKVELRDAIRSGGSEAVDALLDRLLAGKPRRHDFHIAAAAPAVSRHMSVTGG